MVGGRGRMMNNKYKLLSGEFIKLDILKSREKLFISALAKMIKEGISYFEVYRKAIGPESPALEGRNRVNSEILNSPLYLLARDMATRAGIKQGLILSPEYEGERIKASHNFSMISVVQAANLIGISRAAVYKAIDRKKLNSNKIGNVTLVEKDSAIKYRAKKANKEQIGRTSISIVKGAKNLKPIHAFAAKSK